MPLSAFVRPALAILVALAGLTACGGDGPRLVAIGPQTVDVRDTLRVALLLENPENGVGFRYEGPSGLPGIAQTASISGSPAGGEFRWTPQSNHVGTHEFQVILVDSDGDEVD
ncbi:MAG: hypothetical protein AAGF12_30825, partial [Myxococcota bacterium]